MTKSDIVKRQKSKYFYKLVRTYTLMVYIAIVLTGLFAYLYIYSTEGQNAEIIKDTVFLDGVDIFESTYEDFISITDQLKADNALNIFTIVDIDDQSDAVDTLSAKLAELADGHSQKNTRVYVYRDDTGQIVSRTAGIEKDVAFEEIGITSRELKVVTEYLLYVPESDFSIITDDNLIFITQNTVGSKNTYTICVKEFSTIYVNDAVDEIIFWENAQNVLDIREENVTDQMTAHQFFYFSSANNGEIVLSETENSQYRLYKSEYFDIIYCSISAESTAGMILIRIFATICILIPLYFATKFAVWQVTRFIFRPIDTLLGHVSNEFDDEEFSHGEISEISALINRLKEKNIELKDQLEQMSIKAREIAAIQPIPKKLSHEEPDSALDEEFHESFKEIEDDSEMQEKFEQYVIEHISEDIGLRDLSEHFKLSFAYTSTLFKTKMEMNFKEYVSYQRYLHSLEIMKENPKMKIADIAEQVGILNLNTFIRIFKKYNDITPKQYMSMLECKQDEEKE